MSNSDIVRQFYDALNRNDIDGVMELLDPEILRVEFEEHPNGGTYRGLAELRAPVANGRATWAEGACEPERLWVDAEKVVVDAHVRVRLKGATEWLEGHVGDGFVLRGGKIVEFRSFTVQADALKWAGIKA